MFPRTIGQSGWYKRARKAFFLFIRVIRMLAMDTSLSGSRIPPRCSAAVPGRRSGAATRRDGGGVRLLRQSLPVLPGFAAAPGLHLDRAAGQVRPGGREGRRARDPAGHARAARDVTAAHPGQVIIGDKNYFGRAFEAELAERELTLLRPVRRGEARRAGQNLFKPLRQVIESVNWTFKGSLPGTPRRQDPRGHPRPRPGPGPRADRRDLAQRQNRPARHEIFDRLRPLTVTSSLGIIHLGARGDAGV